MRGRPNSARQIETRLKAAAVEIDHWTEYDYVLVNRDVDECLAALKAILAAERLKRHRQVGLAGIRSRAYFSRSIGCRLCS